MILAIIQIFGAEFELVIRPRNGGRPSVPPPTFETTGVEVPSAPATLRPLAKAKAVLTVVRRVA